MNDDTMLEVWVITPRALAQAIHMECPLKHDDGEEACPRMQHLMNTTRTTLKRAQDFDTARMTSTTRDEWESAR